MNCINGTTTAPPTPLFRVVPEDGHQPTERDSLSRISTHRRYRSFFDKPVTEATAIASLAFRPCSTSSRSISRARSNIASSGSGAASAPCTISVNSPLGLTKCSRAFFTVPRKHLLMQLGQFPAHDDLTVTERFVDVGQCFGDAVRGLECDQGATVPDEGLKQLSSRPASPWKEAEVDELLDLQAGHAQGRRQGGRAGKRNNLVTGGCGKRLPTPCRDR